MYLFLRQIYIKLANRLAELTKSSALDYKKRQAMYRMLEKMTGEPATLQINEALIELAALEVDKDKKTRLWYVYDDVLEQMRNSDADFAKALSKFVPQQDTMIIAASEQDDITLGFAAVIENNNKTNAMKKAFVAALAYPLMMLGVLLGLLFYFSKKIIPAFVDNVPQGAELSVSSHFLIAIANSFNYWFGILLAILILSLVFIIWALPNLTTKLRKYLENMVPFNMYRIMVGCGFLFALNSLGRSGFMQIDALELMVKHAKPYLKYRLLIVMDLMADGMDIGQALIHSNLNFPDKQMIRELAIQLKYSEDDSLEVLSSTLADDGLEAINRQAQALKIGITTLVFGTIAFLYYAVYQFGMDLGNVKM